MAVKTDRGIPLSAVNPCFLHANSTSHTGPFSAIAELIDNAYDPDVSAKQFWIDKTAVKGQDCLTFMDNGKGMDYDKMHKMLSFGFSDKKAIKGHVPVGVYGNGFKSGSMRLGKDAIVFSKKAGSMCVGLLSQTYLQTIKAENVIVPIVKFTQNGHEFKVPQDFKECLHDILQYSLFNTEEELLSEFSAINGPCGTNSSGTRIIIWNLRRTPSNELELEFIKDRYDIQIPIDINENGAQPTNEPEQKPDSEYSLQAYTSILYLKPRMQINIRGQKVKTQLVSKSLALVFMDAYRPMCLKKRIKITFGYNTKSRDHYGLMMYHKNRLIKAYERVACQRRADRAGVRVIGVIECNYLTPMHNKQDFDNTEEYRRTIQSLNTKLEEYWKEIRYRRQKNSIPVEDDVNRPDQNWVQCDDCQKWRKLPDGIHTDNLPDKWFCRMNPDNQFRYCSVEQENSDSEDDEPRFQKTFKQHEKKEKEKNKQQKEQEQKKAAERLSVLEKKNKSLKRKQQVLKRQLRSSTKELLSSPLGSNLHRSAGTSPSEKPVISPGRVSSVRKRVQSPSRENRETGSARKRFNFDSSIPCSPSTSRVGLEEFSSPNTGSRDDDGDPAGENDILMAPMDDDDDDDDECDDATFIQSTGSPSPKPAKETSGITFCKSNSVTSEEQLEKQKESAYFYKIVNLPTVCYVNTSISTQTYQNVIVKEECSDSEKRDNEKQSNGDTSNANHFESEKDPFPDGRNANKHPSTIIEERRSQGTSVAQDRNMSTIKSEENNNNDNEISPVRQARATFRNSVINLADAQDQQDKLLALLEEVAKERDESRAQLLLLGSQVGELQSQLVELNQSTLKKEQRHNSTQTNPEEGPDYKALYLMGKDEIEQLKDEIRKLTIEKAEVERRVQACDDDLACQTDSLLKELDLRNKENEDLKAKVDGLENEKCTLMSYCESLNKALEEMQGKSVKIKKMLSEDQRVKTDFSVSFHEESTTTSAHTSTLGRGANSDPMHYETQERPEVNPDIKPDINQESSNIQTYSIQLRDLRQRVARLLVTFVPALDLQQVNYDCDVIDEILTQVIDEISRT